MDREKVIGHLNDCMEASRRDNTWVFVRKDIVEDALTLLKEQEPVRCKDCGYWDDSTEGRYVGGWCFCDRLKFSTSPDWFCADGERKNDDA